jgi:dTDP-4-amino-4,6-dideoxygalactose transaminase
LAGLPGLRPLVRRPYITASYHLYPVRVTAAAGLDRDDFIAALNRRNIGVGVHFRPVHLHPFYREQFGFGPGLCPIAEEAGEQLVSLPLFPDMTDAEVDRVVSACREILAAGA